MPGIMSSMGAGMEGMSPMGLGSMVGAGVGGISGLFGMNSQKKQLEYQKKQERRQRRYAAMDDLKNTFLQSMQMNQAAKGGLAQAAFDWASALRP